MVDFEVDEALDPLDIFSSVEALSNGLSLMCGQHIDWRALAPEAGMALNEFLQNARQKQRTELTLEYEEFNELLLMFNQNRVSRPFFDYFFLRRDPTKSNRPLRIAKEEEEKIYYHELKHGLKRFRGHALLCFGNFRFAFRTLSEEDDPGRFMSYLKVWTCDSVAESKSLSSRPQPLSKLVGSRDEVDAAETWLLGYLSGGHLKTDGEKLEEIVTGVEVGAVTSDQRQKLELAKAKLRELRERQEAARNAGKRNNLRYLTWDFLDVYVATSMRQPWEFTETSEVVSLIFKRHLADLGLRWFDPTQAFEDCIIDKGLAEALMLKRARCTIYMAQEADTFGKDSELAATLAQGKPVIAYVRRVEQQDLPKFAVELQKRPVAYYRQRLLAALAEGFFDKRDNRQIVKENLRILGVDCSDGELKGKAWDLAASFEALEAVRYFLVIGDEENELRQTNPDLFLLSAKFLAAVESRAADIRADTLQKFHPLGMQVHLETGVSNGVLVARSAEQCSKLLRSCLTGALRFDIKLELDKVTGRKVGTVLAECSTQSRFRVVTEHACLSNAFWNFYNASN